MTARHALTSLEREGIVERRQGIGTFVAAPKIHFNKLMSYTGQMARRGLTAGSKVLSSKIIENEEEATAHLSLPPKQQRHQARTTAPQCRRAVRPRNALFPRGRIPGSSFGPARARVTFRFPGTEV